MGRPIVNTSHKWLNIPHEIGGLYNYLDCLATARVYRAQRDEQIGNEQWDHYRSAYWPVVEPVMAMARRGLRVDYKALRLAEDKAKAELAEARAGILEHTSNKDINLNSPDQRATLLYDELELRCGKKTTTGKRSTDQHALDWILRNLRVKDKPAIPVIHALFHRSRWNTILTRYLGFHIASDGRVRPTIKMGRVETLRLAYANPPLQQFPKEIRDIFIPSTGQVFISLDYAQLEARIMAILSKDQSSLESFKSGLDIHKQNSEDLFGRELLQHQSSKGLDLARDYAKVFIYGIGYGGKSETLKAKLFCPCANCNSPDTLSISKQDRVDAENRWYNLHPAVKEWRQELVREVKEKQSLTTPFGYRRFFHAPSYSILPEIYNFPMQATAAGLMNRSMVRAKHLPMVLQMHDELMVEQSKGEAIARAGELRDIMQTPVPELSNHSFPVDVAIGPSWGQLEEYQL